MGRRGPQPKPKAWKVLHGTPGRYVNNDEPIPPDLGLGAAPDWLSESQAATWVRVEGYLSPMGLSFRSDRDLFSVLVCEIDRHDQAVAIVNASGLLVRGRNGLPVRNPASRIADKAAEQIRALAPHFGLSPSSRGGLSVGEIPSRRAGSDRLFD